MDPLTNFTADQQFGGLINGPRSQQPRFQQIGGCCSPLPGEAIVGTVALGNHGITVHRQSCANVETIPTERRLPVRWNSEASTGQHRFPAQLRIEVIDRVGILKDILMRLSDGATTGHGPTSSSWALQGHALQ